MFSLLDVKLRRSHLALIGIVLFCGALFWIAVCCMATLAILISAEMSATQATVRNGDEYLDVTHRVMHSSRIVIWEQPEMVTEWQ
jgi:hypothetical protein